MAEWAEGDSSDDNGDIAQMAGRKIRERDDSWRKADEGHARMMVKLESF